MEQLMFFHDYTMVVISGITVLVLYIMFTLIINKLTNRYLLEGQSIEFIWTVLPAVTMVFIGAPSLRLLYLLDEVNTPTITLKVVGHQWYWRYEYSDFVDLEFDSYILPGGEVEGQFRLLDVDNRTVLPVGVQIRVLVTAADVIHSWTVPTAGVKVDAVPGRLNQLGIILNRPGLFLGQCSEICGANHRFMPIVVEGVNREGFLDWVKVRE